MQTNTPRILITGSSGFIGTHLVRTLVNDGASVIGVDIQSPKVASKDYLHVDCNILNFQHLKAVLTENAPDMVIHLAARTDLDEKTDIQGYAANIDGVKNLVDAIKTAPTVRRCIYTSSQLVCRLGYVPECSEDYCPNTLYGQSKVLTEKIVQENDGGGVAWCLVRPTTVWGPGMNSHYQRFFRMVQRGRYFHVGNRPLYKSYGYVHNIVHQYVKLLEAPQVSIHRKVFYVADYTPISLRDWVNVFQRELAARPVPAVPEYLAKMLAAAGDAANWMGLKSFPFNSFRLNNILTEYQFDLSPTKAVCGELPYTVEEGVKETVAWLRAEIS